MPDRSMIFSTPMVRALLDGRKTQTRRMLKPQPELGSYRLSMYDPQGFAAFGHDAYTRKWNVRLPYAPGDRLWVRERFMPAPMEAAPDEPRTTQWNIAYAAGGQSERLAPAGYDPMLYNYERWSASIHMPRWASRLTLIVTDVRVQRVQEITEADAVAEGCLPARWEMETPRDHFRAIWNSLHGPGSWASNPWVAAITFTVHRCNIDQMTGAPDA